MLNYNQAFNNNTANDLVLTENEFDQRSEQAPSLYGGVISDSQLESSREEFIGVDLGTISEDVNLVDRLVHLNFFHSYLFTLDEASSLNLVVNTGSERAGYSVIVELFQDTNGDYSWSPEENVASFTIFNNGVTESTGFLDLGAGDYIFNISDIIVEGGSSIAYSATLDFDESVEPEPTPEPNPGSETEVEEFDLGAIAENTSIAEDLSVTNSLDIHRFSLSESFSFDMTLSGGSENPENTLSATLYQDSNGNNIPEQEEQIEILSISDSFEETPSTGSLDLAAGNYILGFSATGDSPISYQAALDFGESSGGEIPDEGEIPDGSDLMDTDIFRFQNTDVPGTYLYVAAEEAENIRENFSNFEEEGLAFQVSVEPGDELMPLYRFQSNTNPGTYLFAGEAEREGINDNFSEEFTEEGLAFYVYRVGANQGTAFYRFQNSDLPGTYLFAGGSEAENIEDNFFNFENEGLAFEVGI